MRDKRARKPARIKIFAITAIMMTFCPYAFSADGETLANEMSMIENIAFHNEARDTAKIMNLLNSPETSENATSLSAIAQKLIGSPYRGGTLEGDMECLRVNMDEFDCMTFVETVIALAITRSERKHSWRDFIYNLGELRYRDGIADGYASRLHYFSDWIVRNAYKGTIEEVTNRFEGVSYEVKTIDFMTAHRDLYPTLENPEEYERMKNVEIGYRSHRYPFIKTSQIAKAGRGFLKEGDIIAFTTPKQGLDVTHVGILTFVDGEPRLIHASSKKGEVTIEESPLEKYANRLRAKGIRVVRLKQ